MRSPRPESEGVARDAIVASLRARGIGAADEGHLAAFAWASRARRGATWILGISGPQGGGKSTLAESLRVGFEVTGLRAVAISIDDFYLTRAEQVALAAAHGDNDLLSVRGYPGTHDVALGAGVLDALAGTGTGVVEVPRYDKTAHAGQGDRADRASFTTVARPVDVVVLEGWMLGFEPVETDALVDPRLDAPNRMLGAYATWWSRLDAVLVARAPSVDRIVEWRVDAEAERRRAGLGALDEAGARAYAARFVPAYVTYVPALARRARSTPGWAHVDLDVDRRFSAVESGGG